MNLSRGRSLWAWRIRGDAGWPQPGLRSEERHALTRPLVFRLVRLRPSLCSKSEQFAVPIRVQDKMYRQYLAMPNLIIFRNDVLAESVAV